MFFTENHASDNNNDTYNKNSSNTNNNDNSNNNNNNNSNNNNNNNSNNDNNNNNDDNNNDNNDDDINNYDNDNNNSNNIVTTNHSKDIRIDNNLNYIDNVLNDINMIYEKARSDVLSIINGIDDEIENISKLTASTDTIIKKSKTGNFRNSGLKAVNFTYGEVLFYDFCKVLLIVFDSIKRNDNEIIVNDSINNDLKNISSESCSNYVCDSNSQDYNQDYNIGNRKNREISKNLKFVDLGSGMGSCMAAAMLLSKVLQSRWQEKEDRRKELEDRTKEEGKRRSEERRVGKECSS